MQASGVCQQISLCLRAPRTSRTLSRLQCSFSMVQVTHCIFDMDGLLLVRSGQSTSLHTLPSLCNSAQRCRTRNPFTRLSSKRYWSDLVNNLRGS